jgi:hypothetical protein
MKKLLVLLSFVLVVTQSCDDYLDVVPDGVATIEHAFSNEYQASKYLATCYSYLPNFGNVYKNPGFYGGDEAWLPLSSIEVKRVRAWDIARGVQDQTEPTLNFWSGERDGTDMFDGIRHCNEFIQRVPTVLGLTQETISRWVAEAKFLKAYYMFWLVKSYGPIPIFEDNVAIDEEGDRAFRERNTVDECFSYMVKLIDEALVDLPPRIFNEPEELGRVTKIAALAIKAKILTTAASPLFNGNEEFFSLTNPSGDQLFSEYNNEKWVLANQAIDSALAEIQLDGGHRLYEKDDYIVLKPLNDTLKLECALRSLISEKYNPEILWASAKSLEKSIQDRSFPRLELYYNQLVSSSLAPTLRIAEQFYSKNGVPINEDINYDYENRYSIKVGDFDHRYRIKEGEKTAALHFDREPRFYSTLAFDRGIYFGNGREDATATEADKELFYVKTRATEPANAKNIVDYSITGYWPKKLVHIKSVASERTFSTINYAFPIMRLADLYLLKAEAMNEMFDTPNDQVFEYIDKVRNRAGLKGVKESWTNFSKNPTKFSSKAGMRDIIQQERLIELCMESHRFWDLRRWKKSENQLNGTIRGWNILGEEAEEFYQVTVLFEQSFSTKDYFWPIKEKHLIKNTNLTQNKGW